MKRILVVLYVAFVIKFIFALMPSFQVDMGAWLAWAHRLASLGPAQFYSDTVWTQYTPGYLYWLWFIGELSWIQPLAIKLPTIIFDFAAGYLIWHIVQKTSKRWANAAFLLYVLNPVTVFDGSIWGQIDGILTFAMLLSAYLLIERKNYIGSWVMAAIAFLIKPQAMAMLPVLFILTWRRHGFTTLVQSSLYFLVVVLVGFYPFYPQNPLAGVLELIHKMGVSYSYTSLFAFNIWTFVGMWIPDTVRFLDISYFSWGLGFVILTFSALFWRYRNYLSYDREAYLLFALACFIFFLFPTRVHDRYLFPMFAYLITYLGLTRYRPLLVLVLILSMLYTTNLYLPYSYYESLTNPLKHVPLENFIQQYSTIFAALQAIAFASLWLLPTRKNSKERVRI